MTTDDRSDGAGEGGFRKRSFTPRTFPREVGRALRNGPALVNARRSGRVPAQLVEKVMLATTGVNECRYCARFHAERARASGVDEAVVDAVLERDLGAAVDETERVALSFAQRYAETGGAPGAAWVADLEAAYGPETATDIRAYVRAIQFANLLGNSVDAVAYRSRATATRWATRLRHVGTLSFRGTDR
jgi:AhpD family alkylhydroperoxidase